VQLILEVSAPEEPMETTGVKCGSILSGLRVYPDLHQKTVTPSSGMEVKRRGLDFERVTNSFLQDLYEVNAL
jgi:hypothetical protein